MDIKLGYAEFIRIFNNPSCSDFAPGLEVREDGVFVKRMDDAPVFVRESEAGVTLRWHPRETLSEPVLAFPFSVAELEAFIDAYSLHGQILSFELLKVVERKAWGEARIEHEANYSWPIVAGMYGLRREVQVRYEREDNDSRKVAYRFVLDKLNALLPDIDKEPSMSPALNGPWPWGAHNTKLLQKLAAAADKHWKYYEPSDRSTAPTNEEVVAWLKEQGVSERNAQAMATILRADGLPTGPR